MSAIGKLVLTGSPVVTTPGCTVTVVAILTGFENHCFSGCEGKFLMVVSVALEVHKMEDITYKFVVREWSHVWTIDHDS